MDRRKFLTFGAACATGVTLIGSGCRGHQHGHVLEQGAPDMVGSHTAGSEIYKPLIDEAVATLLAQCHAPFQQAGHVETIPAPRTVCFIGVENRSSEELGDFKDQIYQLIDGQLIQAQAFQPISRRYINAALDETRLRPTDLFLPQHQDSLADSLRKQGVPLDYMMFATVTSGTTTNNKNYQRDYLLTLEMVDVHNGTPFKSQATLRKGYHKTKLGKMRFYAPWKK